MNRPLPSTGTSAPTSSCSHTVDTSEGGTHSPRLHGCLGLDCGLTATPGCPTRTAPRCCTQNPAWAVWALTLGSCNLLTSL